MTRDAVADPTPGRVPRRALQARIRNFRGTTLLAVGDEAFELTETAAFIWKAIGGTKTVADITKILMAEYEVDEKTALADVTELLGTLARAGLLEY